jgi:tRNA A37 threonylcarbamoyladenosine biosynthesis protein TsaE
LIEWPERMGVFTPPTRLEVRLKAPDEDTREVVLEAVGGGWAADLLRALKRLDSS